MKKRVPRRQGKLIANGVVLEKHEMATVVFLLSQGHNIDLIRPSFRLKAKTPDFWMDGAQWEMKSPEGSGKYTIQDTLRRASRQSANIIVDLRRTKMHQTRCLSELRRQFMLSKNIRQIMIITKQCRIIVLSK